MGDSQRNSRVSNLAENALPSPSPLPPSPSSSSSVEPIRKNLKARRMSRQLSLSEVPRDIAWERRRRQGQMRKSCSSSGNGAGNSEGDVLTDEDLKELKGCIDLGFGFNEENGQRLCTTIPALDLYFAVNRVFASSPVSSPTSSTTTSASSPGGGSSASVGGRLSSASMPGRSSSFGSYLSESDSWKICNPGDDPQHVKTKLRHWAQAVACSVKQSS